MGDIMDDNSVIIEKSEKMYAQLVEVYPGDQRFLRKYAELLVKLGKSAQAEKVYEKLYTLLLNSGDKEAAEELEKKYPAFVGVEESDAQAREAGFLSYLDIGLMDKLVMRLKKRRLKEGEYLFRYGDTGKSMFIVIEGSLAAMLPRNNGEDSTMLNLLKRGDIVGEMAMLRGSARSADVVAASDCVIFELERKSLIKLMTQHDTLEEDLLHEAELRHRIIQISRNRLLANLPLKERRRLADSAKLVEVKRQHRIVEGGSLIQNILLLTKGVADVVFETHRGENKWLHDLQAGDMLGENALLQEAVYPADIVAATDVQMLVLSLPDLKDCVAAFPRLRMQLETLVETNMTKTMAVIANIRKVRDID